MTPETRWRPARVIIASMVVTLVGVFATPIAGTTVGTRFLASLRIDKPAAPTVPGASSTRSGRALLNVVTGMLAETTSAALDESDLPVPTIDSASRLADFAPRLPGVRTDPATVDVIGAQRVTVHIDRDRLQTLFVQAGRPTNVANALNGAIVTLGRPRGVRMQYGRCPAPIANTLQNQIQGPPPPSIDNGDCVILTETPLGNVSVPPGLDTAAVMEIALELSGMSPNQSRDFRSLFDWRAALVLSAPRATRSYQIVDVAGARGILMISSGRREPAYALAWVRDDVVYALAGYGSSGDAVPLAGSVR